MLGTMNWQLSYSIGSIEFCQIFREGEPLAESMQKKLLIEGNEIH